MKLTETDPKDKLEFVTAKPEEYYNGQKWWKGDYEDYRAELIVKMQRGRVTHISIFGLCSIFLILLSFWLYGKVGAFNCVFVAFSGGVYFAFGFTRLVDWQLERKRIKAAQEFHEKRLRKIKRTENE